MLVEEMRDYVNQIIEIHGIGHILSTKEIKYYFKVNRGMNPGSIIPSDYCYNRTNNGISLENPKFFEYIGHGKYRCLGELYKYTGKIFHKPKGSSCEIVVGEWVNGEVYYNPDYQNNKSK